MSLSERNGLELCHVYLCKPLTTNQVEVDVLTLGPSAAMVDQMNMELPEGEKTANVFADSMSYLYDSTEALSKSSELNIRWDSISIMELVDPSQWVEGAATKSTANRGGQGWSYPRHPCRACSRPLCYQWRS